MDHPTTFLTMLLGHKGRKSRPLTCFEGQPESVLTQQAFQPHLAVDQLAVTQILDEPYRQTQTHFLACASV